MSFRSLLLIALGSIFLTLFVALSIHASTDLTMSGQEVRGLEHGKSALLSIEAMASHGTLFIPQYDVFGQQNVPCPTRDLKFGDLPCILAQAQTNPPALVPPAALPHEIDLYTTDRTYTAHWYAWYSDGKSVVLYRYSGRDSSDHPQGTPTLVQSFSDVAGLTAYGVLASQMGIFPKIAAAVKRLGVPLCPTGTTPTLVDPSTGNAPCKPYDALSAVYAQGSSVVGGSIGYIVRVSAVPPPRYGPKAITAILAHCTSLCSQSMISSGPVPFAQTVVLRYTPPPPTTLTVQPQSLTLSPGGNAVVSVAENWYGTSWTPSTTCQGLTLSPTPIPPTSYVQPTSPWSSGPFAGTDDGYSTGQLDVSVSPNAAGQSCAITIADATTLQQTIPVTIVGSTQGPSNSLPVWPARIVVMEVFGQPGGITMKVQTANLPVPPVSAQPMMRLMRPTYCNPLIASRASRPSCGGGSPLPTPIPKGTAGPTSAPISASTPTSAPMPTPAPTPTPSEFVTTCAMFALNPDGSVATQKSTFVLPDGRTYGVDSQSGCVIPWNTTQNFWNYSFVYYPNIGMQPSSTPPYAVYPLAVTQDSTTEIQQVGNPSCNNGSIYQSALYPSTSVPTQSLEAQWVIPPFNNYFWFGASCTVTFTAGSSLGTTQKTGTVTIESPQECPPGQNNPPKPAGYICELGFNYWGPSDSGPAITVLPETSGLRIYASLAPPPYTMYSVYLSPDTPFPYGFDESDDGMILFVKTVSTQVRVDVTFTYGCKVTHNCLPDGGGSIGPTKSTTEPYTF